MMMLVAACSGGGDGAPTADATVWPTIEGGAIALPAPCGYTVTTPTNVEAPAFAPESAPFGPAPAPRQIHLGLGGTDAAHGMVISWRTVDDETIATTVQYGKASTAENTMTGLTFRFMPGFASNGPLLRMHEAHLCGLEADTSYVYRVGGVAEGGAEAWSPEYRFRTAPDRATQPDAEVVIVVVGDTRDGYGLWHDVLVQARATASPDLFLFTGDAVTLGPLQEEWDQWFDQAEEVIREVPIVIAHGNHDVNAVNFYAMNAMPGDEVFFGLDYGPLHLVVMNDSPPSIGDVDGRGRDFLEADLIANAAAPWRMVMHHRSLWSASTHHGSDVALRDVWGPVIDEQAVDMVLAGHDHNYERTLPMRGAAVAASPAEGTVYLVAGGGGAGLYESGTDFFTGYSESTQHFVLLRLRASLLELTAYRLDGTMMDAHTIDKAVMP